MESVIKSFISIFLNSVQIYMVKIRRNILVTLCLCVVTNCLTLEELMHLIDLRGLNWITSVCSDSTLN